nr:light-harvesting complex-like protein 3 isotype 1, chloroplastic [Ipomoea batatas]
MSSLGITASVQRASSSYHGSKKKWRKIHAKSLQSPGTKQATSHVVTSKDVEGHHNELNVVEVTEKSGLLDEDESQGDGGGPVCRSSPRFSDEQWRNGSWDLNMFVKNGRMDWGAVIVAEARRRKHLELFPEAATDQEPVLFRSSIIPWWAWIKHSHLPEAELLNGRAAMLGFFMSYIVDALTGLDVVGQAGNFLCKAALFATVGGVMLFRKRQDFDSLRDLVEEATFYDRQWQASWKDQNHADGSGKRGK